MTTSRVGAVIDALVTTFQAGTAVVVFDGPPVVASVDPGVFVLVGANDEAESVVPVNQEWAGLGANARNETGQVPCAVVSHSGSTDIKEHRDAALAVLGELEDAIVADPTLGGAVASGWLLIQEGGLSQAQTEHGGRVSINFSVHYRARI